MRQVASHGFKARDLSGIGVSLGVHVIALFLMSLITYQVGGKDLQMVLDSVFADERTQEDFSQQVEQSNEVSTTMNVIAGGVVSQNVGSSGVAVMAQAKVDQSESLKEPTDIRVNAGDIDVPGLNMLGNDLGEGQVAGDAGRLVEGYGAALGQISQELIRLMRESKVMVVWLFDESDSMRDDQREIREKFMKIYEELGIAEKQDVKLKEKKKQEKDEILLTSIISYGEGFHEHMKEPSADVTKIRQAIDDLQTDESGKENTCQAITQAIEKYRQLANRQKRKLAIIVVSDESGDDGEKVEETIDRAKKANSPVYLMGRYSVFGYPYLRTDWRDPTTGLVFHPLINRGPETAMPELLQFDGFHERWDYDSAGFGPYEQSRIARETGGIFFLLPSAEDTITRDRSQNDLKYELLDMKEYLPSLGPRSGYLKDRQASRFRNAQWEVIQALNPHIKSDMRIDTWHYPVEQAKFIEFASTQIPKALTDMALLNDAVKLLESVRPLRAKEASSRWRANYDLIYAQCLAFRVRLFQYLLAIDAHKKSNRQPQESTNGVKNNMWWVWRNPKMLEPDAEQIKQTKVDVEELKKQEQKARDAYQLVIATHPRTPWARRAERDLNDGFGIEFKERFHDPRYFDLASKVKVPKQ